MFNICIIKYDMFQFVLVLLRHIHDCFYGIRGWEVAHTICLLDYNHSINFRHNYSCYNYVMLESNDINSKIYQVP